MDDGGGGGMTSKFQVRSDEAHRPLGIGPGLTEVLHMPDAHVHCRYTPTSNSTARCLAIITLLQPADEIQ
jgi:hypothetical protein